MKFDPDKAILCDVLRWRRDVRHFRTDPVPEPLLDRLRAAMDLAPSVGNARPWRVLRIDSPAIRAGVRRVFEQENALAAEDYHDDARTAYLQLKLSGLDRAPVQLAVFTDTDPPEGHGLGRRTMPETLAQSTAMAIHTLWLTARAHNLGLGMVSILDPARVAELCDVPPGWQFTAWLCIGWPESHDDTPLLHRTGWQENTETHWETR